jgi:Mrp family chromosome partitioning ATPase
VPVPATGNGALRPFFEALRDRVAVHLERISHKPKLVAVTGCSPGSGVTTLAAGLAASLSETGDGKVLLVDMNLEHGAVHPFFRGQPSCGLLEALEKDKGQKGQVQQNLVLAAASSGNGHGGSLVPRKFANLMPKLVATDYDFVIFDMPPVSQTSVTPRLARLMDMTLMVIESEKTQVDVVRQASALLQQSKADVAVVLNKTRSYVPRRLLQEL